MWQIQHLFSCETATSWGLGVKSLGLRFGVWVSEVGVEGLGIEVWGLEFEVRGSGVGFSNFKFGVESLGFMV